MVTLTNTNNQIMDTSRFKILVVDDDEDILELVAYNLSKEGFKISIASNGLLALDVAEAENPDLILLDVMMPFMNGIEACTHLRQKEKFKSTLISFLSASAEDYALVAGYDAGADDYIVKPIKPHLLVTKVKAILRRHKKYSETENFIFHGDISMDLEQYMVFKQNKSIILPHKEFEILRLFLKKPGKVFTRDEILNRIWSDDSNVSLRNIDVHIKKLREKVGDEYFKTLKGVGYKFSSPS